MKFYFQSADSDENKTVATEFEAGTWYEALNHFVQFLQGSGYGLTNKSVGINESAGHLGIEDLWLSNITSFEQE